MLEDHVADYVDLQASSVAHAWIITEQMTLSPPYAATAGRLHRLVRLSISMPGNSSFARQLRRNFL